MAADRRRIDRVYEGLAAVSGRYVRAGFYALVLGYVALVLAEATTYGSDARLFPLLVGVPLAVLLALKVALELSSAGPDAVGGPLADVFREVETHRDGGPTGATRYRRDLAALGWLVALVALVRLLGLFPASFVFVAVFVYRQQGDPGRALALAAGTTLCCYLLFERLLSATTYGGLLAEVL